MAEIETYRKNRIKFEIAKRDGMGYPGKGKKARTNCFWCCQVFSLRKLTLDRLIPKSLGGTNAQANLVLACKPCNNGRDHLDPAVMRKALSKLESNNELPEYRNSANRLLVDDLAEFVGKEYVRDDDAVE